MIIYITFCKYVIYCLCLQKTMKDYAYNYKKSADSIPFGYGAD